MVAAGLEVHVRRCAGGSGARLFKRNHLGVRRPGFFMPSLAHDFFFFCENTTHARIRRCGVEAFRGELERTPHHGVVKSAEPRHLRLLRVDLTSCTASRKSSGVSKLR